MGKKSKKKGTSRGSKSNRGQKGKVASPRAWKIGDKVVVCGLKQATQFNGKSGTIISEPNGPGSRYGVSVGGHKIAVLPSNLDPPESSKMPSYDLEDVLREENERNSADADSMAAVRLMMNLFMTEEKQIELYGRKIQPLPDFRDELRNAGGGFPKGVDPKWAAGYLRTAFEQCSQLPHTFELCFKSRDYDPPNTDILKRIGTNHPDKIKWYCESRMVGDIFPQMAYPYSPNIRHSYSNQAYRKEVLLLGTTHAAVGFVDLGILLEADIHGSPRAGMGGPLRFLGIESSPYAVAKTLVVWEMVRQSKENNHLRYAMQVWFSTTIEGEAEEYVKKILTSLCNSDDKRHPNIDALLQHWRQAEKLSLQKARSQWASRSTTDRSSVAHFVRQQDRIDMTKYELTGDFGIRNDGKPTYGNIVMLDCPEGTPPLSRDETVFSSLNWKAIASSLSTNRTVFEASEEYIMERLSKLASWARHNILTVNLVCDDVQNVTDLIAASKPWTMSWSNVLDYMDHADFHQLARACSIHGDTLHFGYSMNWPKDVFGVNIIDYGNTAHTEQRRQLIEVSNQSIEIKYKMFGWDNYLRLPPPTNPINTTSYVLEMGQYKNWVDHFFRIGQRQGPCKVGNVEHSIGSPLSPTGSSTVSFTWTYDPEIKFNALENNF